MIVYVEYVFIDNFVIDFLLLKTAFMITGKKVSRGRLILCSLLGAIFALVYPLITENFIATTTVKILFGLFLAFCAAKFSSVKEYAGFTAVFTGLTFFLGGAVIGVFSLFDLDYSSEYSVALMILPVYVLVNGVMRLIRYFYRKKDVAAFSVRAEIVFGDKTVTVRGFFDTGNSLYDGLTPVIVVSRRALTPLISPSLIKTAKYITVTSAVGEEKKISFKPDNLVIYSGDKKNIFYNVRVCATEKDFDGYDAILHPAFMENVYEKQIAV